MNAGQSVVARDIVAGYGSSSDVLHGVSLVARPGEVTTLIGPNGCGKSTLLKTMSKVLTPRAGTVTVGGEDVHSLSFRQAATRIAMLAQNPVAPDGLRVGELVARGRHPHRDRLRGLGAEDREAIERACAETSVTELVDRDIAELSGGQRQRVWLAMALAQDTPALLLDEPTTFLDPAHAIAMLELARGQARRGKAVVMVLHDLMLAGMYSDTLVVMKQGRILAEGAPSQALTPQVLEQAYGLRAEVWEDPAGGSPVIVPRGVVYSDWPN